MKKKTYNGEKRLFGPLQATACLREKRYFALAVYFFPFFLTKARAKVKGLGAGSD